MALLAPQRKSDRPDTTIPLSKETYRQLEALRRPRDSFDAILNRLLRSYARYSHLGRDSQGERS